MEELALAMDVVPPVGQTGERLQRYLEKTRYPFQQKLDVMPVPIHYKDPAKIAADREKRLQAARERRDSYNAERLRKRAEAYREAAFNGLLGNVATIGWSVGDDHQISILAQNGSTWEERDVIASFADHIIKRWPDPTKPPLIVVHNAAFSLRFIWQRAVVNSVALPRWWPAGVCTIDPGRVYDTMVNWTGPGARAVPLPELCHALGIPGEALTERDRFDAVIADRWGDIVIGTQDSVRRVRCTRRRLTGRQPLAVDIGHLRNQSPTTVVRPEAAV